MRRTVLTIFVLATLACAGLTNHRSMDAAASVGGAQEVADLGLRWRATRRGRLPAAGRLPTGRSYYNGGYYGNLNNRFYGPQYGYF